MDDARPARGAVRWLAHPASLVAVAVLAVNDHLLKPAFASWWTGKLSDLAGLVFAPALLAVVLSVAVPRVSSRALVPGCVVAVGAVFVVIKATGWGAMAASQTWSALRGPSVVLADWTDLCALPALGIAWVVGRRAIAHARERPASGRLARVVAFARWGVALPCAVLATAATAASLDPDAQMVQTDGDQVVVTVDGAVYYGGVARLATSDGVTWAELEPQETTTSVATGSPLGSGATAVSACVPSEPKVCYRALSDHLGVERSADGGATWAVDWSVPDDVRAVLAGRYLSSPAPTTLSTVGVAVLTTDDGHVVVAANGRDGVAVRHEDGVWERVGFLGCCDEPDQTSVVALPGADDEVLVRTVPVWPLAGTVGTTVAFVMLAWALRGRRPARPQVIGARVSAPSARTWVWRRAASIAMALVAALWLVAALQAPAVAPGQVDGIEAAAGGVLLAGPPVLVLGSLATAGLLPRRIPLSAYGWALVCGLFAAVATAVI